MNNMGNTNKKEQLSNDEMLAMIINVSVEKLYNKTIEQIKNKYPKHSLQQIMYNIPDESMAQIKFKINYTPVKINGTWINLTDMVFYKKDDIFVIHPKLANKIKAVFKDCTNMYSKNINITEIIVVATKPEYTNAPEITIASSLILSMTFNASS